MSTDPDQPKHAPAPAQDTPAQDSAAAPTVAVPSFRPPPPPPPAQPPQQHTPPTTRMPAQGAVPSQEPPTRWDRPEAPRLPQDRPQGQPQPQWQPQSQQAQPQQAQPQQAQWQPRQDRPQQQPQQSTPWTEAQPWVEPTQRSHQQSPYDQPPPYDQRPPYNQQSQFGQQPPGQPPVQQNRPRRRRRRPVRRSVMALFTLIVILVVLVIADRVALAITENSMASDFQQQGFPAKPNVSITGFPFLTQLLAKDFKQVNISASNVPVPLPGGGTLTIQSVNAKVDGLHISGYSSSATARVDDVTANAFVSYNALAAAAGVGDGTGLTFKEVNSDTVQVTGSLGGLVSASQDVQITTTGPQTISVKAVSSGSNDILGSVLSAFGSYSFNLPKGVPPTLKITQLSLNSQGLTIAASATNATFSSSG